MGAAAALGGAGLISGYLQNQSANSQANKARKSALNAQQMALQQSQPLIDRQVALFDAIQRIVQSADAAGQFDSAGAVQRLNNDNVRLQDKRLSSITQAAKSLGFTPGDSRITDLITTSTAKGMSDRDNLAAQLRQDYFFNKLNAYSAIPGNVLTGAVNSVRGLAGDQTNLQLGMMNHAQGQMVNPSGFFSSMMPFFQQGNGGSGGGNNWTIDWLRNNTSWSPPTYQF